MILDKFDYTLGYVSDDKNAAISDVVVQRRQTLKRSLREVADRSEKGVSHSQLSNLENQYSRWKGARPEVVRGIERGLDWPEGYLWSLIHDKSTDTSEIDVTVLDESDYTKVVIVLLSAEGTEVGERTVTTKRQNANAKLYGFTNHQSTVHSVIPGQSVKIISQKTFDVDDMVLVKASGQVILAYALDKKAARVTTIQGLELRTEKVWGRVVERLENEGEFKRPRTN
jgi:hypothetical protein